jgi:polysaccharide biosynthesis protein PslF
MRNSMKHTRIRPSVGFLSTYPPTSCGLATFTTSLRDAIAEGRGSDEGLGVVSVTDIPNRWLGDEVVHEHVNGDEGSLVDAIDALNSFDVASIQHEYGIYGGPDGDEVLELLEGLRVPAVVTLHTVLSRPSKGQRSILEKVVAMSARTIVMSETAYARLINGYAVDEAKVRVIPHGARIGLTGPSLVTGSRPVVLTWGLIGPGKGLEMAIDAFAGLGNLDPVPRYVILGKTHPKVQASQGDAYLEGLAERAHDLGLDHVVEFDSRYLTTDELTIAIRKADIIVLPYDSTEQVTSGVLVEALAAGKPVIATAFPHAVELLDSGAGIVVPHGDVAAMAAALRRVLTHPSAADDMEVEARLIGSTLHWPAIADRYLQEATALRAAHVANRPLSIVPPRRKAADALIKVG